MVGLRTSQGGLVVPRPAEERRRVDPPAAAASPVLSGEVHCHWLQGTVAFGKLEAVQATIRTRWEGIIGEVEYGQLRYDRTWLMEPWGIKVFYDSSLERCLKHHAGRVCVAIPGQALDELTGVQFLELLGWLAVDGFEGSRVDVAFDDFERVIEPHAIVDAIDRGDGELPNMTGFRRWEAVQPRSGSRREGDAVNFGVRGKAGSGRFLQVYDKALESGGQINAVRWEVRFFKDSAAGVVASLSASPDESTLVAGMASLVGGSVDFVERQGQHLERMGRLAWWSSIVERLGRCRWAPPRRIGSVEKSRQWVACSVAATLAKLGCAYGWDWLGPWVEQVSAVACERLSVRQKAEILEFRRRPSVKTGGDTYADAVRTGPPEASL